MSHNFSSTKGKDSFTVCSKNYIGHLCYGIPCRIKLENRMRLIFIDLANPANRYEANSIR